MALSRYFEGKESIKPRTAEEARALIGQRVTYLRQSDIDKSGRGYIFPQTGVVAAVVRNEIAIDDPNNFVISRSSLVEMVLAPLPSSPA